MVTSMAELSQISGWDHTYQPDRGASLDGFHYEDFALRPRDSNRGRRDELLRTIVEAEILPRLARSRRDVSANDTDKTTADGDTRAFVHVLLTQDTAAAVAFIETLLQAGAKPGALYRGIITLAARCLGELWQQDRCGFAEVTIGMGSLQVVLRTLSRRFQLDAVTRATPENVLLLPAPGEQHTFGLVMLAEFFLRDGWHVAGGPMTSTSAAADMVRRTWFDVAGFSIGSTGRVGGLAECIRAVRRASRNPNICVMVGGPMCGLWPDLAAEVGADCTATDAESAVRLARELTAAQGARDRRVGGWM